MLICTLFVLTLPEPSLKDLERFPNAEDCRKAVEKNSTRHQELVRAIEKAKTKDEKERLSKNMTAVRTSGNAWKELQEAVDKDNGEVRRINGLRKLRKIIGDEFYRTGTMPPPIPAELVPGPKEKEEVARGRCRGKHKHHRIRQHGGNGGCQGGRCAA